MSQQIIFASHNQHKVAEIQKMMPAHIEIISLADLNFHEEIEESATTFAGNALIKAQAIAKHFQKPCFADDSGLEIDALNGAPGVYSARYAGPEKSDEANMNLVLEQLQNETNRKANFKTVIAYVDKDEIAYFEGKVDGQILREKRGTKGFGYDPLFLPDGYELTFAELSMEEKNTLSHRARALKKFVAYLEEIKKPI